MRTVRFYDLGRGFRVRIREVRDYPDYPFLAEVAGETWEPVLDGDYFRTVAVALEAAAGEIAACFHG